MIKIDSDEYLAEQVVEIVRENTVPVQKAEEGFSIQDHIASMPLQLQMQIILFDKSVWKEVWHTGTRGGYFDSFSGVWVKPAPGASGTTWEEQFDERREDSYERLRDIYDGKQLVKVDCSEHAENAATDRHGRNTMMIYEDMAMTYLGQAVQRGDVYLCDARFTQITKTAIETAQIFVQEVDAVVDDEGNETSAATIRWSKDAFEPTTVEPPTIVDQGSEGTLVLGTSGFYRTGRVHKVPTVWQLMDGVLDVAKGLIFGGNA